MNIKQIQPEDTWEIRRAVMWPDKPLDFVKLREDNDCIHFGLYHDSQLTSVVSCYELNGEMQFRKFATLTDKQNQGLGTYLLRWVIEKAKERGVKRLWCNARLDKKHFYSKFGLTDTGQRFEKEGIKFTIMEMKLDQNLL